MSNAADIGTDTLKQVTVRPRRKPQEKIDSKLLPPYVVILHNDDFNTFDFVIEVIMKVFHYPVEKAVAHTLEAHQTGRSVVWSGSKEVAELKAEQIHSCGADPEAKSRGAQPLQVSIEAQ
ncbi:MAG TPA: ATP-dependent Clp protease adaptor ClpS [Gemmatales bacterium]|nr:ATP-dependent Clp protease adaptor ClpS [Gemmatales bacterium]